MKPSYISNCFNDFSEANKSTQYVSILGKIIKLAVLSGFMYGFCLMLNNSCISFAIDCWSAPSPTIKSPLDQFEINNLLSLDAPILANLHISLTNVGLYLTITACVALIINLIVTNYSKIIANSLSISQESVYATIHSIVINQINANKGQMYFSFIYGLFVFILINNLIGMVPYSFAATSHFIMSFFISFTIVLGASVLGFYKHGLKFFSLFVPAGCPLGLLPLLVLIEFISYLARNVSLGLRLAANIIGESRCLILLVSKEPNSG